MLSPEKRQVFAWAFYDWANSAFATVVIAGFFPIFFKEFWSIDAQATESTFRLGVANSVASLVVLILAPVLGAIADQGALKKRFLLIFAVLGIVGTAALGGVSEGLWLSAAIIYVMATIGFSGANVLYDALLVDVAPRNKLDSVSGIGFSLGYLGGGLLFALCVVISLKPQWFGLANSTQAVKASFYITAIWWAVFSLPLFKYVHEDRSQRHKFSESIQRGINQLIQTFRDIRQYKPVIVFLVAYWLYIDGVDTIVRMAVDYGLALGFTSTDLITALLLVQFIGFPSALAFGWLGERIGPKLGILIGLSVYIGITIWAYFISKTWEFYGIAIAIGVVQGGVQALSRSLYARLIPAESAAEFFGFYNFLGKFAAVIGPVMMGWVAVVTGSTRISILSILILFVAGGLLLMKVDVADSNRTH
ncbi:MAG: MFS transporter [Arenicellales bacterium]|nr:MFS transporter [Arenicellales bacterium]